MALMDYAVPTYNSWNTTTWSATNTLPTLGYWMQSVPRVQQKPFLSPQALARLALAGVSARPLPEPAVLRAQVMAVPRPAVGYRREHSGRRALRGLGRRA